MKRVTIGKKIDTSIDTIELMGAMEELEKTNGISKDVLMESIQNALVFAYKKNFDSVDENIKVLIDEKDNKMKVYQEKLVVEIVENDKTEISLEDARNIDKKYELEDKILFELKPKEFGRIAAQTAKQVILQKIREVSRDVIFEEFSGRVGELVTGIIQKADGGSVIVDIGKIGGIMPKKEQLSTEEYRVNDTIKACILNVDKGAKGLVQVIISRANTEFVKRLLEIEIPEISEGIIEIKSISRDPGSRTKLAVYSQNPNIDPVGSCVGQKGIRIQNIINELKGEKIDVVEWNEEPSIFISAALLPASVLAVDVNEEEKFAQVIVPDDQLSLAIGKAGQNAKLAAKLTNWKIDIKSESQFRELLAQGNLEEGSEEVLEEESEVTQNTEESAE